MITIKLMKRQEQQKISTHERILQAAKEVFALQGISKGTTREIAERAGVNEVTLFRHFKSKEQLLLSVVEQVTTLQTETASNAEECTGDLATDINHYAQLYEQMLFKNEALIRNFIGEASRHPETAEKILAQGCHKLRNKLVDYLQEQANKEKIRADLDVLLTVDQFTGMLLAGMIRRITVPSSLPYTRQQYLASCVDYLVRVINITH